MANELLDHGSPMFSNAEFLSSERLQEILLIKDSMYAPIRGQFTEEKNILERYNSSFLPCSQKLRRIWNFVETKDTELGPSIPSNVNTPVTSISSERRDSVKPTMSRIVDAESAAFCAGHHRLHNEAVVLLNSDHSGLPCFEASDAAARAYIQELKCFIVEFTFKVDVHSFSRGETDRMPLHAMPSMTELLRDGPSQCLQNRCSLSTNHDSIATGGFGLPNDDDFLRRAEGTERVRLHRRRRSTKDGGWTLEDQLKNGLRWIHIPCNHMSWVPEVLHAVVRELVPPEEPIAATKMLSSLLDWQWWESKQNVPPHGLPHARFMEPYCHVFPTEDMKPYFEDTQLVQSMSMSDDAQVVLYVSEPNISFPKLAPDMYTADAISSLGYA
jgi:hypothetical protein